MSNSETAEVRCEVAPFQADFVDTATPCAKAIIGAKGSGKTWIGARFIAKMVDELPGSKGIFACTTNQQAEDIWQQDIKPLLDQLNWPYRWNQVKGVVRFFNGTVLHIRTAEKPERIESIQYGWGWQDEVSLASLDFCKTIRSRIRGMHGTGHARFTSMPDDPEHFIYDYLEQVCESFHEVTLQDNPDKAFVASYTKLLKQTYSGAELDRYLYAKRISLTGLGLFAISHEHRQNLDYDPDEDLYLVWDFNVEYRAVTAWQRQGSKQIMRDGILAPVPVVNCIEAFQLKNFTTVEDAKELCEMFRDQKGLIYLHGDASGENRSAQTSDSMWNQIRKVFKKQFPNQYRFVVPKSNPNVKDTIQVTNWAIGNDLMHFSDKASTAYRYLAAAKSDKYGEIDKSNDYEAGGAKTHEVDTIRYVAWHIYRRIFPGRPANDIFTPEMVRNARKHVRQPEYIGEIMGEAELGPKSLKNLTFQQNPSGNLKVWMLPDEYPVPKPVSKRGACFLSIGGISESSKPSVIKVIDRAAMVEGGAPACAAEWSGHLDPIQLAWKAAQIASFFYKSLLAVRVDPSSEKEQTQGTHHLAVFNQLSGHYLNLYIREKADKVKGNATQYGYLMDEAGKSVLISGLKSAWRQSKLDYVEHNKQTIEQACFFEVKDNGTMKAMDGEDDSSLLATAGAMWLASDYMRNPYYIKEYQPIQRRAHMAYY